MSQHHEVYFSFVFIRHCNIYKTKYDSNMQKVQNTKKYKRNESIFLVDFENDQYLVSYQWKAVLTFSTIQHLLLLFDARTFYHFWIH